MYDLILSGLIGILGACIGAYASWKLQRKNARDSIARSNVASLRYAQLKVASYNNALYCLWHQHLRQLKDDPNRHTQLVQIGVHMTEMMIDVDEMSFLVEIKKPDLLLELHLLNNGYENVIGAIKSRNELIKSLVDKVNPVDFDAESGQATSIFRADMVYHLKAMTDNVYDAVQRTLEMTVKLSPKIAESLKDYCPDANRLNTKPLGVQLAFAGPDDFLETSPGVTLLNLGKKTLSQ